MSQNLKAGDLALITGAFSVTENIGRAVQLVEFVPPFGSVFHQDGYFDADAPGLWIVTADDLVRNAEGGKVVSNLAGCDPQHLRPIRGGEVPTPKLEVEEFCHLFRVPA